MRKERKIINTNIRLNLLDEQDRKAWGYLQTMDRKKYKSYTKAVVIALNDYFDRENQREADPYLETREKEDAFLKEVVEAVKQGAEQSMPMVMLKSLVDLLQPIRNMSAHTPEQDARGITDYENDSVRQMQKYQTEQDCKEQEEAEDAALDFADSF